MAFALQAVRRPRRAICSITSISFNCLMRLNFPTLLCPTRPHNWKGRQYKSDITDPTAPKRQKAYRERNKDRNATVTVTATRADTEQKQITEQKKETRVAALSSGFDAFWFDWPNKVGKPAALRAYRSVIARGATIEEILVGVQNYIRDKPPDRPWLNPASRGSIT
jgi:hypothetical protein